MNTQTAKVLLFPRQIHTPEPEAVTEITSGAQPEPPSDAVMDALRLAAKEEIGPDPVPDCAYCDKLANRGVVDIGHSCPRLMKLRADMMIQHKYGLVPHGFMVNELKSIQQDERRIRKEEEQYELAHAA